jgi:hypothetical protein
MRKEKLMKETTERKLAKALIHLLNATVKLRGFVDAFERLAKALVLQPKSKKKRR